MVEEILEHLAADRDPHPDRVAGASMAAEAIRLSTSIGWTRGRAGALLQLARYQEPPDSLETNSGALRMFRRLGDRNGEAATLNNLALIFRKIGLLTIASQLGGRAYRLLESDSASAACREMILATQTMIHADAREYDQMLAVGAESIAISRSAGSFATEARVATTLSTALLFGTLSSTARHYIDDGLKAASRSDHLAVERGRAMTIAAEINLDLPDYEEARDLGRRGSHELERLNLRAEAVIARLALAQALSMLGDTVTAVQATNECLPLVADDDPILANVHLILGELELRRGMTDRGIASLTEALRIATETDDGRALGAAHLALYRVRKRDNDTSAALQHLEAFHRSGIDHARLELPLPFTEYSIHEIVARRRRSEDAHRLAMSHPQHPPDTAQSR